jgi:DNA-binding winged helix-turn-helix (wHTH) protein/WD40 repeat protein
LKRFGLEVRPMPGTDDDLIYEFGAFRLDPVERLLFRDDRAVPLTPKAFDLLTYLLQRHGRLAEKHALLAALWPNVIVEEANLAWNVSALRKVLGDEVSGESMIQTVPTKGYRFVGAVTTRRRGDASTISLGRPAAPDWRRRTPVRAVGLIILFGSVVALTAIGAISRWFTSSDERVESSFDPRRLALSQLTANPPDLSITSARISPDGRYIAFADRTGIHVRHIDSGDTQAMPNTEGMDVYAWSPDGTKVRASACDEQNCVAWDVSVVAGSRHRSGATWPKSERIAALPDGSRLLRISPAGDVKVDYLNGAPASVVCRLPDPLLAHGTAQWSGNGTHILLLGERNATIQSVAVGGGPSSPVFVASNGPQDPEGMDVHAFAALPDGRLLVVLARAGPDGSWRSSQESLWEVDTDARGVARASRRQLTPWRRDRIEHLSVSADARRIAFLGSLPQIDIYTADFDADTGLTSAPKRLTFDERDDTGAAWTPDSKALVFASTRNGIDADLFVQRLDSGVAEPLVVGPGDQEAPCVTSDGRWVLYRDYTRDTLYRLVRVPLGGGLSVPLFPMNEGECQCAAADGCILWDHVPGQDSFFPIDPQRGKGKLLFRLPETTGGALSPDGSQWAFLVPGETQNRIRIVSLDSRRASDLVAQNTVRLHSLCWVSGNGFLAQDYESRSPGLVYVTRDGRSRLLWFQEGTRVNGANVSPDGKHVVIDLHVRPRNVWLVQPS